jgi:hypothetical protein
MKTARVVGARVVERELGPILSNEQCKKARIESVLRDIGRIESEIESVLPDEVHLCDLLRQVRGELMRIEIRLNAAE